MYLGPLRYSSRRSPLDQLPHSYWRSLRASSPLHVCACLSIGVPSSWPTCCSRTRIMNHKLIKTIPILLFLSLTAFAQTRREPSPSAQERARALAPLIVESARRYGIDARILQTICFVDSR